MAQTAASVLTPETPDWMKTVEAAARMGCTQRTIRNRLRRGSIPVRWAFVERTILLNRAQFLTWLQGEDEKAPA